MNGRRRGGKEVILEERGVRVEVEDTSRVVSFGEDGDGEEDGGEDGDGDGTRNGSGNGFEYGDGWEGAEERLIGGEGAWKSPSQDGFGLGGLGTPSGRIKMIPTAMPPTRL